MSINNLDDMEVYFSRKKIIERQTADGNEVYNSRDNIIEKRTPSALPPLPLDCNSCETQIVYLLTEINNKLIPVPDTLLRQRYYDETRTSDSTTYTNEEIFDFLSQNAENIFVINDGPGAIYIKYTSNGSNYSSESILYKDEAKKYINVHTLQVRAPIIGVNYRVTEFEILSSTSDIFTPISKGIIHNIPLPAIGTGFFDTALSPTNTPCIFRIQAGISITGTLSVTIINGGNTQSLILNAVPGPSLTGGSLYAFDFLVDKGDTINFTYSITGGTIQTFKVQELDSVI